MQSSPARMRVEREAERRGGTSVVLSTVLSLLVVVAAVAAVAWLVLRTPSQAVDSAERLDPVGTALPAPTEPPVLPTLVPTTEPESEAEPEQPALAFTGEQPEGPEVSGLPTVAAPESAPVSESEAPAGPTPTPRVIAQPTAPPPTPLPPPPTLPPSAPVTRVPVVALEPVEAAPVATSAPVATRAVSEPTSTPADDDDDPFNIFDDDPRSRVVDIEDDPLERVRAMQEEMEEGRSVVVPTLAPGDERRRDEESDIPDIAVPTPDLPSRDAGDDVARIVTRQDDPYEIVLPDVDAMIDEITAQANDPNRNPNAREGRRITERDERADEENNDEDEDDRSDRKRRRSARDIIEERIGRRGDDGITTVPGLPGSSRDNGQGECRNPFANLPEDKQPKNFPFDDC